MKLSDFDYPLPESSIADRPPLKRGTSRLLALDHNNGSLTDSNYSDLPDYIRPGDLLVINNTRVIKARLQATTMDGGKRELLLLETHGQNPSPHQVEVMYRRKLHDGQALQIAGSKIEVAKIHGDGTATITSPNNIYDLADQYGSVPLPPYMHRTADSSDTERYQTVFAKTAGSVAAPTASLNLTQDILTAVQAAGATVAELTLHVGLGTFMPIRTDDITDHVMHQEYFSIPQTTVAAIQKTKTSGGRVIAVGTTVTRTLEYAASKICSGGQPSAIQGEADIFMYPGYKFELVDAMLTNFHAPHSTVLMMAAAFAGWDKLRPAYQHAVKNNYKFLSYGDSMFIY